MTITVSPLAGRDYKRQKEAINDFNMGKLFVIRNAFDPWDGKTANKEDLKRAGYDHALIRYDRLRKLALAPIR